MAITASDIAFHLSVKTGSAGDTTASTPAASLGKYVSTTTITDASDNNLFDDVTGDEASAGDTEYRCIFVRNNHATLTWQSVVVWLSAEASGGATIEIAVDDIAASDADSASAQADEIADESTAPGAGVGSFSAPTTKGAGLALGNIAPDFVKAIWVKRVVASSTAAKDADSVTIRCEGDTAA